MTSARQLYVKRVVHALQTTCEIGSDGHLLHQGRSIDKPTKGALEEAYRKSLPEDAELTEDAIRGLDYVVRMTKSRTFRQVYSMAFPLDSPLEGVATSLPPSAPSCHHLSVSKLLFVRVACPRNALVPSKDRIAKGYGPPYYVVASAEVVCNGSTCKCPEGTAMLRIAEVDEILVQKALNRMGQQVDAFEWVEHQVKSLLQGKQQKGVTLQANNLMYWPTALLITDTSKIEERIKREEEAADKEKKAEESAAIAAEAREMARLRKIHRATQKLVNKERAEEACEEEVKTTTKPLPANMPNVHKRKHAGARVINRKKSTH